MLHFNKGVELFRIKKYEKDTTDDKKVNQVSTSLVYFQDVDVFGRRCTLRIQQIHRPQCLNLWISDQYSENHCIKVCTRTDIALTYQDFSDVKISLDSVFCSKLGYGGLSYGRKIFTIYFLLI